MPFTDSAHLPTSTAGSWDAGKRQVWVVALLHPKYMQLRQGMKMFNSTWSLLMAKLGKNIPSSWQEGSIIQLLEEWQFQWGTNGDTQPEDCVRAVNISHGLATAECIWLMELCSFTLNFCLCRNVSEGTLGKGGSGTKGTMRLSPTCSRNPWGVNLNCWVKTWSIFTQHLQGWEHPSMFFLCPWNALSSAI